MQHLAFVKKHEILQVMLVKSEKSFNEILFNCVLNSLSAVLGVPAVDAIYFLVQKKEGEYNPDGIDFRKEPLQFLDKLEIILGRASSEILRSLVLADVKKEFRVGSHVIELGEVVNLAKTNFYSHVDFE